MANAGIETEAAFVVIAEFEVKSARMADFLVLAHDDARHSVADEAGCRQFDVVSFPDSTHVLFTKSMMTVPHSIGIWKHRILRASGRASRPVLNGNYRCGSAVAKSEMPHDGAAQDRNNRFHWHGHHGFSHGAPSGAGRLSRTGLESHSGEGAASFSIRRHCRHRSQRRRSRCRCSDMHAEFRPQL